MTHISLIYIAEYMLDQSGRLGLLVMDHCESSIHENYEKINVCCFKLLFWGITYHAAVGDQYTREQPSHAPGRTLLAIVCRVLAPPPLPMSV